MVPSKILKRTTIVFMFLAILAYVMTAPAAEDTISLDGYFGGFAALGDSAQDLRERGPDHIESEPADNNRVASTWYYFNSRGIRVRVCNDDQRVGAINAAVTPATRHHVTEAGVRIGENLESVASAYGDRLEVMPQTEGTIWFVDGKNSDNRLTFGFTAEGEMTWVSLGALRANEWTCGVKE